MKKANYPFRISYKDFIVMRLVADGNTALQISDKLGLSQGAIKSQITTLRKAFNCKNITHLSSTLLRKHFIN
jgi:DNA-binding CsgD family transcriptional regulator